MQSQGGLYNIHTDSTGDRYQTQVSGTVSDSSTSLNRMSDVSGRDPSSDFRESEFLQTSAGFQPEISPILFLQRCCLTQSVLQDYVSIFSIKQFLSTQLALPDFLSQDLPHVTLSLCLKDQTNIFEWNFLNHIIITDCEPLGPQH